jgi:dipeptidyl aminopeptidase/acylaminoacyl peptidase
MRNAFALDQPLAGAAKASGDRGQHTQNARLLTVVTEARWKGCKTIMAVLDPATGKLTKLYEGSMQDHYHNPEQPLMGAKAEGQMVLQTTSDGSVTYFTALGASPKGDMPFVAVMPIAENAKETYIWQSQAPFYEVPTAVISSAAGVEILARRESVEQSPNYFLTSTTPKAQWTQVANFPDPDAELPMPSHPLLHFKSADGVDLTAELSLPAGYDKSKGPLPTLMEAYPAEFKSRGAASQVTRSPYEFVRIGAGSPMFFAMTSYAVLANAAILNIGEGSAEPNDTYTEQLVDGAKAAIDAVTATGSIDRGRVVVMGHFYGGFMTANLLAHSDLFRASIARSGAYNRSLTPFGFQNEERTHWQAPDVYNKMRPFMFLTRSRHRSCSSMAKLTTSPAPSPSRANGFTLLSKVRRDGALRPAAA